MYGLAPLAPAIWAALGFLGLCALTVIALAPRWIANAAVYPDDEIDLQPYIGDLDAELDRLLEQDA